MIKKIIRLPKGGTFEIDMEPEFLEHVSRHFGVKVSKLNDDHIRRFIWSAAKNAIDKYEVQQSFAAE